MNDSLGKAPAGDQDGGPVRMSRQELRSSLWLASLYAIRMLGLFLVLPVFALHARQLPGGDDPAWVGFGAYGLTQALLQIPYGAASDRFGRKQVITVGLLVMAAGSVLAAMADTVAMLALGRALQGAGAVSAAISALVADSTRDENRSKAMALIGVMIAMSYAVSLVVGPVLYQRVGLSGMFLFTGALALLAIGVLWRLVPNRCVRRLRRCARCWGRTCGGWMRASSCCISRRWRSLWCCRRGFWPPAWRWATTGRCICRPGRWASC